MVLNAALQAWIVVCSAAAIWLLNDARARRRRLGCWIGLAGQPAWIWSAIDAQQFGIFLLALWYVLAYSRGIRRHVS